MALLQPNCFMKKILCFLSILLFFSVIQSQPTFYGLTTYGTISKYNTATNSLSSAFTFNTDGITPVIGNGMCKATNGKLYGMLRTGGGFGYGLIFSLDPATNTYVKLKDFDNATGGNPFGNLIQAKDGKLYGLTSFGGEFSDGVIFSFDPISLTYSKLKDLDQAGGSFPNGSLVEGDDGKLYGMTHSGGAFNKGVIFSFTIQGSVFTKLKDFESSTGFDAFGSLIQGTDKKLYGMTYRGGSYDFGVVFSFDLSTSVYSKLRDFNGYDGGFVYGSLIQGKNGKLYGMSNAGGNFRRGLIFSIDPTNAAYEKLKDFNGVDGTTPYGNLVQLSNGKLYGMTPKGGTSDKGVMFSFDPATATYTKLKDFEPSTGNDPYGNLVEGETGKLFGMTRFGGFDNKGVIFSCDLAATNYTKLKEFTNAAGTDPQGSLLQTSNGKFYGMSRLGGSYDKGVLFSFNPTTATYKKHKDFDGLTGATPYGSLIQYGTGKLYGVTRNGGIENKGVIFSFDPSNAVYAKLYDFSGSTGSFPSSDLLLATDGKLYGLTFTGANSHGSIYSFNPSSLTYTKLKDFDGTDGKSPLGSLVQASNGKLYGTANGGGINDKGVIFSFDPATNMYEVVKAFDGATSQRPSGSLVQSKDGKLYGLTVTGGNNHDGDIFSFDPVTSIFTQLHSFNYINGAIPFGSLVFSSDEKLYGMTCYGGANDYGVIFSFDPATSVFSKLQDFDLSNGGRPTYGALVEFKSQLNVYYRDADGDGFGDPAESLHSSTQPAGYVLNNTDCSDYNATIYPGAPEICDKADNDCNGLEDDGINPAMYYTDRDLDGYGDGEGYLLTECEVAESNYIANKNGDCDDSNENINPGASEICGNNVDENCNGIVDDGCMPTRFIKVNIFAGANPYNNTEWNNWNVTASLNSGLLKYSEGTVAPIKAILSAGTSVIDNGTTFGGGMAPAQVLRHTSYTLSTRTLTFSGLNPEAIYSLELYSSRNNSGRKLTIFTVNDQSITVLSDRNLNNKALFTNLTSTAQGTIVVTIKGSDRYNYLNGFIMTENENPLSIAPVADAGEDKTIALPPNTTSLNGNGTDEDGIVVSYKWTKVSGPAVFTINKPNEATTDVTNLIEGTYIFRLTVTDNDGAIGTDDVQVLVKGVPPPVNNKYVKVNVYGGVNPYNHPEWTDWNTTNSLNIDALKYTDATASSINATLSASTGIIDNGSSFGAGMAPASVLRYTSYTLSSRTLTLSGLSLSANYNLELYSSRNNLGRKSTIFTINGQSDTVLSDRNLNNKVVFENITSNMNGTIVITIKGTDRYNFLNGFILTENSNSQPATITQQESFEKVPMPTPETTETLQVSGYPNPAAHYFTVVTKSSQPGLIGLRVTDATGRVVEVKQSIINGSTIQLGQQYKPGIYYVEVLQGIEKRTLKLIKTAE